MHAESRRGPGEYPVPGPVVSDPGQIRLAVKVRRPTPGTLGK